MSKKTGNYIGQTHGFKRCGIGVLVVKNPKEPNDYLIIEG